METRDGAEKEEKGGKKLVIFFVIIALVLLAAVVFFLLRGRDEDNGDDQKERDVLVTRDNLDTILTDFDTDSYASDATEYIVTMNARWNFPNGHSASSDAYVENTAANKHAVYFDVQLADTNEKIYESPVIPLGKHIEGFSLDKDLPAGTYNAIVTYHLLDDKQNTLSTVSVSVKIVVQS